MTAYPDDSLSEGITRALQAAEAANDAAGDLAALGAAHRAFADRVTAAQKRTASMATGAMAASAVAMVLSGLVYFRSVADLREAADLQTTAAKLVAEQVTALKENAEKIDGQSTAISTALQGLSSDIKQQLADAAPKPIDPATISDALRAGLKEDMAHQSTDILQALAEMDAKLGTGAPDAAALSAKLDALAARLVPAAAAKPANAGPKPAAKPAAKSTAKPPAKPVVPPTTAFSYP